MTTKTLDFQCELKANGDTGTFEGYGSIFNITDRGGDIVVPGAFTETLAAQKAAGRLPAMLWQHRQAEPIGVYTSMEEDAVGLKVQLAFDGQQAVEMAASGSHALGAAAGLAPDDLGGVLVQPHRLGGPATDHVRRQSEQRPPRPVGLHHLEDRKSVV